MKVRAEYTKLGDIKYISHLDLMRLFQRAFQRANIPVIYSEGFNPHPLFTLGNPLSLGVESESEFLEIEVEDTFDVHEFQKNMNRVLPTGVSILQVMKEFDPIAIQKRIAFMAYTFTWEENELEEKLKEDVEEFLESEEILIHRMRKKGRKKVSVEENIRSRIHEMRIEKQGDSVVLYSVLEAKELSHLRPDIFLKAFLERFNSDIDPDMVQIKRVKNYDESGKEFHGI